MLKLKKVNRIVLEEEKEEEVKKVAKEKKPYYGKKNKLPPEDFKPLVDVKEVVLNDTTKIVIQVKRGGEFDLPVIDLRQYIDTDNFTGFTKKGFSIPLELFAHFSNVLMDVIDLCEEKGLYEEVLEDNTYEDLENELEDLEDEDEE